MSNVANLTDSEPTTSERLEELRLAEVQKCWLITDAELEFMTHIRSMTEADREVLKNLLDELPSRRGGH